MSQEEMPVGKVWENEAEGTFTEVRTTRSRSRAAAKSAPGVISLLDDSEDDNSSSEEPLLVSLGEGVGLAAGSAAPFQPPSLLPSADDNKMDDDPISSKDLTCTFGESTAPAVGTIKLTQERTDRRGDPGTERQYENRVNFAAIANLNDTATDDRLRALTENRNYSMTDSATDTDTASNVHVEDNVQAPAGMLGARPTTSLAGGTASDVQETDRHRNTAEVDIIEASLDLQITDGHLTETAQNPQTTDGKIALRSTGNITPPDAGALREELSSIDEEIRKDWGAGWEGEMARGDPQSGEREGAMNLAAEPVVAQWTLSFAHSPGSETEKEKDEEIARTAEVGSDSAAKGALGEGQEQGEGLEMVLGPSVRAGDIDVGGEDKDAVGETESVAKEARPVNPAEEEGWKEKSSGRWVSGDSPSAASKREGWKELSEGRWVSGDSPEGSHGQPVAKPIPVKISSWNSRLGTLVRRMGLKVDSSEEMQDLPPSPAKRAASENLDEETSDKLMSQHSPGRDGSESDEITWVTPEAAAAEERGRREKGGESGRSGPEKRRSKRAKGSLAPAAARSAELRKRIRTLMRTIGESSSEGLKDQHSERLARMGDAHLPWGLQDDESARLMAEHIMDWLEPFCLSEGIYLQGSTLSPLLQPTKPKQLCLSPQWLARYSELGWSNVESWCEFLDLGDVERIYVPIHTPGGLGHWTLMVFDLEKQAIEYYDSMAGSCAPKLVNSVWNAVKMLCTSKGLFIVERSRWGQGKIVPCLLQDNSYDCGLLMLFHIKCRARGVAIERGRIDTRLTRCEMLRDIEKGREAVDMVLSSRPRDEGEVAEASNLKDLPQAFAYGGEVSKACMQREEKLFWRNIVQGVQDAGAEGTLGRPLVISAICDSDLRVQLALAGTTNWNLNSKEFTRTETARRGIPELNVPFHLFASTLLSAVLEANKDQASLSDVED